jgi:murein L,D-transpeptidase YcbB/YkuD
MEPWMGTIYAASGNAYQNVFIEHLEMGPATYLNIDAHGLFKREQRAFSHGCIRMDRPAVMAAWVLGGEEKGWSLARVNEIIAGRKRQVVVLDQPIPVYILYCTSYVNPEDNTLYFYEDIYGRDKLLAKALFGIES